VPAAFQTRSTRHRKQPGRAVWIDVTGVAVSESTIQQPLDIGAVAARGKVIDALPVPDDRAVADDASIVWGKEAFASAADEPALPQTNDIDEASGRVAVAVRLLAGLHARGRVDAVG
jgi:hypothetical protein